MTSTKPYLLRAIHEWCVDNGFTPYLQVAVDSHTRVPREHVKDGQIVLNLGLEATHQMSIGNDEISFQARFSGAVFQVVGPIEAVIAIYARDNGQGMRFEVETAAVVPAKSNGVTSDLPAPPEPDSPAPNRPKLTRVK